MEHILPLIVFAAAVLALWLVLTWYFADDTPIFAPHTSGRVTFKIVIKNALHDVVELTRPVWMRLWLNAPFAAMLVLDGVSLAQQDLRAAIYGNPWGLGSIILLNAVARYGSTSAHAPVSTR